MAMAVMIHTSRPISAASRACGCAAGVTWAARRGRLAPLRLLDAEVAHHVVELLARDALRGILRRGHPAGAPGALGGGDVDRPALGRHRIGRHRAERLDDPA